MPAPPPGDRWDTGIPSGYLRELVTDWAEEFDWRGFEARLNEIPQFTTVIDGQRIHFAHIRSAVPDATPVLLTHGWPGSFLEFLRLIGPLTDPEPHGGNRADAVHLIIPSLPGFGFSTPLHSSGWTTARIATAWVELMDRLGYERFAVQGGDLGAAVSPEVGRVAPDRVIGVHVNGALGFPGDLGKHAIAAMSPLEQDRMLDKFRAWTRPLETLPDEILGREWILANASLYWFTGGGGSSAYDIGIRSQSIEANTIARWRDVEGRGGHFAALEEPRLLMDDLRDFLRELMLQGGGGAGLDTLAGARYSTSEIAAGRIAHASTSAGRVARPGARIETLTQSAVVRKHRAAPPALHRRLALDERAALLADAVDPAGGVADGCEIELLKLGHPIASESSVRVRQTSRKDRAGNASAPLPETSQPTRRY